MHKLARLVGKRTGIRVEAGFRTEGRSTHWHLQWSNGPSAEVMGKHAKAAAKSVPGIAVADVGYQRDYGDRFVVAAWLRGVQRDGRDELDGLRYAADSYFWSTSFPQDIPDDDELWSLVDHAFEVCGGPSTYSQRVIEHIVDVGINGLRIERWRSAPARRDPRDAAASEMPKLDVSVLSQHTRSQLAGVVSAIKRELVGRGPHSRDLLVQVMVGEATREILQRQIDQDQRRQALLAVADGTPLYQLSSMLGLSPSTLGKRWDTEQFGRDLAPLVWLREHDEEWTRACVAAAAAARANSDDLRAARDMPYLVGTLERTADTAAGGWRRLIGTPDSARSLLEADRQARESARSRRRQWSNTRHEPEDDVPDAALARLAELLAQYDAAPVPRRRGGALLRQTIRSAEGDRR